VLEEAQEVANIGSWEWDVAADEIPWSDELYRVFGQDPKTFEATFEAYMDNIHPEDAEEVGQITQEGRETGEPFTFEHRIVRPDGEVRYLHCRGQVPTDAAGDPIRRVGTAQDVTERHETRERLRTYAANLEAANRVLEHFAYVASHDLKEPLRTVNRYVQRLEQHSGDEMDAKARECVRFNTRGVKRMDRPITDLRAHCRTDHSEAVFETVDLDRVLDCRTRCA
jgi:PAS domain S-box-containing protein